MVNTKNILIIGRTGSGKSALANLLVNEKENFEEGGEFKEIFEESDGSISKTQNTQSEKVEINGVKYCVIDTVGIGSSIDLTDEEITYKIIEVCRNFEDGLTQILFLVGGRFAKGEIKIYNVIKKKLFDEEITNYTTIVRTKFHNFRDPEQFYNDIKELKEENKRSNKKIRKMANSCNKIIYIDNPSLSSVNEEEKVVYKKRKKESRDILIKHLETCQNVYNPDSLELISEMLKNGKEDELGEILKKERQEIEKNSSFRKVKQLFRKKPETEEEIKKSSLEAFVEINSKCRQM